LRDALSKLSDDLWHTNVVRLSLRVGIDLLIHTCYKCIFKITIHKQQFTILMHFIE